METTLFKKTIQYKIQKEIKKMDTTVPDPQQNNDKCHYGAQ
jgi:cell division protein FtsL